MTDRSTDNPEDKPVPLDPDETAADESVGADDVLVADMADGEAAEDLDAAELEAAASAAEEDPRADTRVVEEEVETRPTPAGPVPRAAAKAQAATRAGGRTAIVVDPALRIRDRASQVFVVLTVVVFVAIFANAMLFGVGGAVITTPAPTPVATPASSGLPAPSGSAAPTITPSPSTS